MAILDVFLSCLPTLIVLLVLSYIYYTWRFSEITSLGIKGPRPFPVLGNLLDIFSVGFIHFHYHLGRKYGKVAGYFMGRAPHVTITDPEILKQIMVKKFTSFQDRQELPFRGILMKSVFDSTGSDWRHIRNNLTPAFSAGKLKKMTSMINDCGKNLMHNIEELSRKDEVFEAKCVAAAYAMDVIAATAFGLQLDSQRDPHNPFLRKAKKVMDDFEPTNPMFLIAFFLPFVLPLLKPFGVTTMSSDTEKYFYDFLDRAIKDRKCSEGNGQVDLLQMLLDAEQNLAEASDEVRQELQKLKAGDQATRKGFSYEEIVAQCLLFMFGGYDTTSTSLSFFWYNLATHPDCQEKVIQEIDEIIDGAEPNYDNVSKLEYMQMCLDETLRIFPPVLIVDRMCLEDVTIEDSNLKITKGMAVAIPIRAIHLDPGAWDEPEKFIPERFTAEAKSKRHPFQYMPFGHGPRHCIGKRLALMEIKMAMVNILQKYKFVTCERTEVPLQLASAFLTKSKNGIWIKAVPRGEI